MKKIYRRLRANLRGLTHPWPYTTYMRQHKVIFIHVPRTAGTSIRLSMGGSAKGRDHLEWYLYQVANPEKFEKYFKFAFVRNPFDRLASAYAYYKNGGNQGEDLYWKEFIENHFFTFREFVHEWLTCEKAFRHALFKPQSYYVIDGSGKCMMDFIGRYEQIESDWERIIKYHLPGLPPLQRKNNIDRPGFRKSYDREMIRTVQRLYRQDLEIFGYTFGELV
ncbi:MAG: sulfotransferase family 2 domain-containing protein [Desulfobacterales bacterium]